MTLFPVKRLDEMYNDRRCKIIYFSHIYFKEHKSKSDKE